MVRPKKPPRRLYLGETDDSMEDTEGSDLEGIENRSPRPKRHKSNELQEPKARRPVSLSSPSSPSSHSSGSPINDDNMEKITRQHMLIQRKSIGSPMAVSTPALQQARRLSLRQTYENVIPRSANMNGSFSDAASSKRITDAAALREIYQTSIDLYTSHKITQQNAFSLKLIECLQEIIKLDTFESTNMQESGRTLEVGGKIYVCRVDATHNQVMSLANEIGAGRSKKKAGQQGEDEEGVALAGDEGMNEEDDDRRQKTKKKRTKVKQRHIKSEESLEMEFNFARRVQDRRETLEGLFDNWIENDQDFDYNSILYRHIPAEEIEQKPDEEAAQKNAVNFSLNAINPEQLSFLIFYPFYFVPIGVWTNKAFDLYGRLLPQFEPEQFNMASRPGSTDQNFDLHNKQMYPDPEPCQSQYGDDGMQFDGHDDGDPCGGNGYPGGGSILDECGQIKPVDPHKLTSLDQLSDYYLALKRLHLHKKDAYGWAGPNFMKTRRPPILGHDTVKPKKARAKKDPEVLNFLAIDWKHKNNRYQLGQEEKTQLDEATLKEWLYNKTSIPYEGVVEADFDDDEEEFDEADDVVNVNDENYVDPLLRYFVDQNRNLLQLFSTGRHQADMSCADDHNWTDPDDGPDLPDVEGHREFGDDFGDGGEKDDMGSQSMNFNLYSDALRSFAGCFPNPIPGQPNPFEDPLSDAYNADALRYAKQPKPIDIHHLKKVILGILVQKLNLEITTGQPLSEEETSLDLVDFFSLVMDQVESRTRRFLSISIVTVALLHIVVEHKLFMESDLEPGSNGRIVCKGSKWKHERHIPGHNGSGGSSLASGSPPSHPSTIEEESMIHDLIEDDD